MEKPKTNGRGGDRGGRRPRKPDQEKKVQVSISLSPAVIAKVRASATSPSKFLEQLLREYYGISDE